MATTKQLLEVRSRIKRRKPTFLRQSGQKLKRLEKVWRKPKGIDSKLRLGKRGHPVRPSPGYGSPRKVLGMHPSGLRPVIVASLNALQSIKPGIDGIVLSRTLGMRKRMAILKAVLDKKLIILQSKQPAIELQQLDALVKKRKESKAQQKTAKEKKKQDLKKEAAKKEQEKKKEEQDSTIDDTLQGEEKKKEEKKEFDKQLIHST